MSWIYLFLVWPLDDWIAECYPFVQRWLLHLAEQGQGWEDPDEVHHGPPEILKVKTVPEAAITKFLEAMMLISRTKQVFKITCEDETDK